MAGVNKRSSGEKPAHCWHLSRNLGDRRYPEVQTSFLLVLALFGPRHAMYLQAVLDHL